MAVYTVGSVASGATYLTHTTAYAAALADVDHGYEIRTVESGIYAGQTLNTTGLSNGSFTKDPGVDYTIELDNTAIRAWIYDGGLTMTGGCIKTNANRPFLNGAGTATFTDVEFYITSGATARVWDNTASGVNNFINCRFLGDVQTMSTVFFLLTGGTNNFVNTYISSNLSATLGVVYVSTSTTNPMSMTGVGYGGASPLVRIDAGQTVSELSIYGSYAQHLVDNNGVIATGTYAYNTYDTTDAGTDSATDQPGIADFKVDNRGIPMESSPLFRLIPPGQDNAGDFDALGSPRHTGGRVDGGPLQNQTQPRLALELIA